MVKGIPREAQIPVVDRNIRRRKEGSNVNLQTHFLHLQKLSTARSPLLTTVTMSSPTDGMRNNNTPENSLKKKMNVLRLEQYKNSLKISLLINVYILILKFITNRL